MTERCYRWLLPLQRVELLTLTDWWADMQANRQWLDQHWGRVRFYPDHWRNAGDTTPAIFDALRAR